MDPGSVPGRFARAIVMFFTQIVVNDTDTDRPCFVQGKIAHPRQYLRTMDRDSVIQNVQRSVEL